jgi:hypothetical protein
MHRDFKEVFARVSEARYRSIRVRIDLILRGLGFREQSLLAISLTIARNTIIRMADALTFVRFGAKGLKKYELLFVKPAEIEQGFMTAPEHHFGLVARKVWKIPRVPVSQALNGIPQICARRVLDGTSWEDAGELERVMTDRKAKKKPHHPSDPGFIAYWSRRYGVLDAIIEELRETGRLRPQKELSRSRSFRERGGIGVMVDSEGRFILCDGHHRFGIALALKLNVIPVSLISVHPQMAKREAWAEFYNTYRYESSVSP